MSAEILRRAAALMRERAEAAWCPTETDDHWAAVGMDVNSTGGGVATAVDAPEAEHIASWDPVVALAVAELLSFAAETWSEDDECRSPVGPDESCGNCENCDHRWTRQRLLSVARAYLGESA